MLFFAVALYFALACLVTWMVLFPTGRTFMLQALAGAGERIQRHWQSMANRRAARLASIGQSGRTTLGAARTFLKKHYALSMICLVLVAAPPLIALLGGERTRLNPFQESPRAVNTQVASLLEGESLVPPPPLPPMAFATAEVRLERPLIASASRDWGMLDGDFEQRLLTVFKIMKERHGYEMALLEGYRSPQRQQELAQLGPAVTNAGAFQSWHQYGLAADSAFVREGRLVISEKDPWAMRGYQLYGEVAESVGLVWGGRWKMMDLGHTELRRPGTMKRHAGQQ